jgi:hypothetical protein
MLFRAVALIGAFVFAAAVWADSSFTPAPTFSGPHPAVARVVAPESDGTAFGSGTLVAVTDSSGLVITNWHVVRDAVGPISVWFPDGFHSPALVLRTDKDWDLAALAIWRPRVQPVLVANAAPQLNESLTIAGYGSGSYRAVTGRCTQYVSPGGDLPFEMVELSAPARNGDSGGPIFNDRGELAGVLFGSAFGRTTGSYCGRLRWFLNATSGDFDRASAQATLALQAGRNTVPVAAINGPRPQAAVAGMQTTGQGAVVGASSSAISIEQMPPTPTASIPAAPAGPLPTADPIKTVLALIGIVAVIYQSLRILGWAVG